MDEKLKHIVIGALLVFVTSTTTMYLDKNSEIKFWAHQENFQYQKFLFEERINLFERYQKITHSPTYQYFRSKNFSCSSKECNDYIVEFKTTLALIKEFFPNTPTKLIEEGVIYQENGEIDVETELLLEISEAMSKEFNYELTGFGYKSETSS